MKGIIQRRYALDTAVTYCIDIERYIYIFGGTFDPPQLSLHFYSNLQGKLMLIWDATSTEEVLIF